MQAYQATEQSRDDQRNWLRLIRAENVGPKRFFAWYQTYGNFEQIFQEIESGSLKNYNVKLPSWAEIDLELQKLDAFGGELITYADSAYPELLRHISDPPPVLSVVGRKELLHQSIIGIVGARNASYIGQKWTRQTVQELGQVGFTIISGLARGIDGAAHTASLQTGTIAVIAGGLNHIYPNEHRELYGQIREQGLIISETAFDHMPQARHFPKRNRIIAGIASGLVVVEAAMQSGSLITARNAIDYNRELFVVPGSPMDPRYQGGNMLLKKGAYLVQNAQDIIETMDMDFKLSESSRIDKNNNFIYEKLYDNDLKQNNESNDLTNDTSSRQTATQERVLESLSEIPIMVDELSQHLQVSIGTLQLMLSELEMNEKIIRHSGNRVSLKG